MKKTFFLLLAAPIILASCNISNINTPKSPFDDHYQRIGMESKYQVVHEVEESITNQIKLYISGGDKDDVSHYKHENEYRDLKYAYFGKESSTISQCSMLSQFEDNNRYSNNVTIDAYNSDQQIQTANAGIIKTNTKVSKYAYDPEYKNITEETDKGSYIKATVTKKNGEAEQKTIDEQGAYTEQKMFYIKPLEQIKEYFNSIEGFDLYGPNAICGTTINTNQIVLKEGFSVFDKFTTTMSRSYVCEHNYFYEGLLEKDNNDSYHFTYFRFYHELLILSKAIDGSGVPVIYLDKPALIEYSEDQYWIDYKGLTPYTGDVPFTNLENK